MPGVSSGGLDQPSTKGEAYGRKVLDTPGDSEPVFPTGVDSGSIFVKADPANEGYIYIGWDEEVSQMDGMYLEPGAGLSFDINVGTQPVFAVADEPNDELRYMAMN